MTNNTKTPEQIAADVLEQNYGPTSPWGQPNEYGEAGFTLALIEDAVTADSVVTMIAAAIEADRAQRTPDATAQQLAGALIAERYGDIRTFTSAMNRHALGMADTMFNLVCAAVARGMHHREAV